MFALVDCDCFFVSCERLFQPKLQDKPVIVLSNNDGCAISRSKEAKALGIGMGTPYFSLKPLLLKHQVAVFSSNYALYGDISARVMQVLSDLAPACEVYSIDEAFLDVTGIDDLEGFAKQVRSTIWQYVGIPVTVGIGRTKTLAKIATEQAKKSELFHGVCCLTTLKDEQIALSNTPIKDVWGVGRQLSERFKRQGLSTALDLSKADDSWIRRYFTITGLRTVHELRGIPTISLENAPSPKQSIAVTRSFGRPVVQLSELQEAMSHYVTRAAEKLRREKQHVKVLMIFARSSRFNQQPCTYCQQTIILPEPTDYTPTLTNTASIALKSIFKPGVRYKKCGVLFLELTPAISKQLSLFAPKDTSKAKALMQTMDQVNRKMGKNTLYYASAGTKRSWQGKSLSTSPAYTTSWKHLPVAKAGS